MTALVPPPTRDVSALGLTLAALDGVFRLQVSRRSGAPQYPPREIAPGTLDDDLVWTDLPPCSTVLATTVLHASGSAYFRELLPWPIALLEGPGGVRLLAHALDPLRADQRARLGIRLDRAGRGVICARSEEPAAPDGPSAVDFDLVRAQFLPTVRGSALRIVDTGTATAALVAAAVAGGARRIALSPAQRERLASPLSDAGPLCTDPRDTDWPLCVRFD